MNNYDSAVDTLKHIKRVNELLIIFSKELLQRAIVHDDSKLQEPEKSTFDKITPMLKGLTYGSDEYNRIMSENKIAISHHQLSNSHHPEYYQSGIEGMNLFDIVEMFLDWKAASERHADGNIYRSFEVNQKRFNIDEQIIKIFKNTVKLLK